MQTANLRTPEAARQAIKGRVSVSTLKRWLQTGKVEGQVIDGIHFLHLPSLQEHLTTYTRQYRRQDGSQ